MNCEAADPGDAAPKLEVSGSTATITLRRPRSANRIEAGDIVVLQAHLNGLRADASVRCVILTGTGRHFSAGYDIGSVRETLERGAREEGGSNAFASLVDAVEALPQVTVCAINGGVFGGSTDLALACDFRIGVPTTRMLMPAARLGLHYYGSGMRRFVSRLGLNAAKRLFLLAEELDAEEMRAVGFLNEVVAPADLLSRAHAIADSAATTAPLASSGMKALLNAIGNGRWDASSEDAERACLRSDDLREGVEAWREKRRPVFRGQ